MTNMICDECETVAHCMKNGCVPKTTKKDKALKLALEALEKCDSALAEELVAWDIDPPLHHVLEASNACDPAITAIREALASEAIEQPTQTDWEAVAADQALTIALLRAEQPAPATKLREQEPVAWWNPTKDSVSTDPVHRHNKDCQPLYTSPPAQRTWVGLTDEDLEAEFGFIDELLRDCSYRIEAKLKEKNSD